VARNPRSKKAWPTASLRILAVVSGRSGKSHRHTRSAGEPTGARRQIDGHAREPTPRTVESDWTGELARHGGISACRKWRPAGFALSPREKSAGWLPFLTIGKRRTSECWLPSATPPKGA